MSTLTFYVPGMSCGHCERAVTDELVGVAGVEHVAVDLTTKLVTVSGADLDRDLLVAAIGVAGYDVAG
jgi:copper chaperone CopZ